MASVAKYSALAGKTRSMFGRLLDREDYRELVQKRSVNEIAAFLKNSTPFANVLADCDETTVHRGRLENLLKRELMQDYYKLASFSKDEVRNLIKIVYRKHEVESLKLLFRAFDVGNVDRTVLEESLLFLSKYDRLSIPKLALSRNAAEFVAGLKGSEYYDVLAPYISELKGMNLFRIETVLDTHYYSSIYSCLKRDFHGSDLAVLQNLFGTEIDMCNLLTIYRCRIIYQMDRDVAKSYLIYQGKRLNEALTDKLLDARSSEEFRSLLADTRYISVFDGPDESLFDLNGQQFIYRLNVRMFKHESFTPASVISYLRLKEIELRNIVSVIEGIRYRLTDEKVMRYVTVIN